MDNQNKEENNEKNENDINLSDIGDALPKLLENQQVPSSSDKKNKPQTPREFLLHQYQINPHSRSFINYAENCIFGYNQNPQNCEWGFAMPSLGSYMRKVAHKLAEYHGLQHMYDHDNDMMNIYGPPGARLQESISKVAAIEDSKKETNGRKVVKIMVNPNRKVRNFLHFLINLLKYNIPFTRYNTLSGGS